MVSIPTQKQLFGLVGWLAVTFAAAAVGAFAAADAGDFYEGLTRPSWAPPSWLFAPAWSLLYLMMALAAWLVWRRRGFRHARMALSLFLLQLTVNSLWTWFFFVWHQGTLALLESIVLWWLIVCTLIAFWRARPFAGALLVPYLAWVTFATALTYSVWRHNPSLLT